MLSLDDVSPFPEVEETEETLEGNARLKAVAAARASGLRSLADDSGLFVDALGGAPGVHSARYAPGSDADRVQALLRAMEHVPDGSRSAAFRCVLALASPEGEVRFASGECRGEILRAPRGGQGFGYDPVFLLPALGRTMAELSLEEKGAPLAPGPGPRRPGATPRLGEALTPSGSSRRTLRAHPPAP